MKKSLVVTSLVLLIASVFLFSSCSKQNNDTQTADNLKFGGYESQVKWGEHLVKSMGCGDCHTPKKMTPQGPVDDETLFLSGHPSKMPPPDVNRKEIESKGLGVTDFMTAWVGPWGITYAGNLTSDQTGIGSWTENSFITAIREGKFKGIPTARPLLPPMPWMAYKNLTDDELKAIFAFLKSTKPINNAVPQYQPPVSAPPEGENGDSK